MKKLILNSMMAGCLLSCVFAYELPLEVVNAMANESWGRAIEPAWSRQEMRSYFMSNWKDILSNIESLPKYKFDPQYNKQRVLPSYSLFFDDCEGLEPLEYLDFLEHALDLAESGRIDRSVFFVVTSGTLEKHNFLSVNYQHPRVAAILQRKIALVPPDDKSLRAMLEKSAGGALADNYMTNKADDAPLPQTLPGIRLKRPWGSVIKKYERLTGKKVPPDPDFPEEVASRPLKRNAVSERASDDSSGRKDGRGMMVWTTAAAVTALTLSVVLLWKGASRKSRERVHRR